MMIINDWLDDRIEERSFHFVPAIDPEEFGMLAGVLRAEAVACGYRVEALEKVCGGDIATYLMARQQFLAVEGLTSGVAAANT